MTRHSHLFLSLRFCLFWLCIAMITVQISQALNDDFDSSSNEDHDSHPLDRRSSQRVAQMLQQILQRGEMQVHPYHIYRFLHRLQSRVANN